MKTLVNGLLLVFFVQMSYAQNDPAAQQFIQSVIHEKGIVYADSLGNDIIDDIRHYLKGTLADNFKLPGAGAQQSGFTKKEKLYIKSELTHMGSLCWQPGLLDSSRLIKTDTITKIFKSSTPFSGWEYFNKNYGRYLYRFSKPIFLRNHTICIFYYGSGCGWLCGGGGLYIYIRKNGIWKMRYTVYAWVS